MQCHSVHEGAGRTSLKDNAVFEERVQTETCLKCHKKQKADMRLASHHPLPEGKMACVSCHNPHGGIEGNLKADSSEELCARCHVEKVGPFANEHPPVADSCLNCHLPHGSANDKLLKQAPPYLCVSCHKFPHTTTLNGFTGVSLSREEQRGSCMDCPKEIHGSDRRSSLKD
ncbi:MAG: cytochrome c3 family protein [Elusimicrobiota bacterium]